MALSLISGLVPSSLLPTVCTASSLLTVFTGPGVSYKEKGRASPGFDPQASRILSKDHTLVQRAERHLWPQILGLHLRVRGLSGIRGCSSGWTGPSAGRIQVMTGRKEAGIE